MLTQLVRCGRVLKVDFSASRCEVRMRFTRSGSVKAGTAAVTCEGIETSVDVESDQDPDRVARVVAAAESTCYALAAIRPAMTVRKTVRLNGSPLDLSGQDVQ